MTTDEIQEQREALLDNIQEINEATWDLIDAVEKYVRQEISRSSLIWRKERLKRLFKSK